MTDTASHEIDSFADTIDSRDVIARLAYLAAGFEDGSLERVAHGDEHAALDALASEAEGYGDWEYGEALIRDGYFRNYAMELAESVGLWGRTDKWPHNCIDWNRAADELKMDYATVDFRGVRYWIRA